jgi:hypothetical protein
VAANQYLARLLDSFAMTATVFVSGMKMEGETDRFPKTDRYCHTSHAGPHPLSFQLPGADRYKDDRYARKYLVAVLHRKLKLFGIVGDHKVQFHPSVGTAERFCVALQIRFLFRL